MADPHINVKITAQDLASSKIKAVTTQAAAGLDTFAMAMQMTGATLTQLGSKISGFLDEITNSFLSLEMKTAEAATILGEAAGGFDAVARDVDKVSEAMGNAVTKVDLAAAAYDVYSVGITDAEDRLIALELASMAAVGGITDTATAVRAGAGAMNAFGLTVDDLNTVYDIQFNLVEKGVITYEQLANVSGRVNAEAAMAGQSLQVSSAALAAITKAGIPAQQAAFRLSAAFRSITKVSAENREKLSELGIEILDAEGNYNSMTTIVNQLNTATEGLSDSQKTQILDLIAQDSRARSGISTLMQMNDEFQSLSLTIDEAGSLQEKFGIITDTSAFKLQQMNNRIEDNRAALGEGLTPATLWATEIQVGFYEQVARINPELVKYGGGLLMIAGKTMSTIGPIMQMIGSIMMLTSIRKLHAATILSEAGAENIGTIAKIKGTIATWAANIAMYACPLVWIIAAIIALVVVIYLLIKHWDKVTEAVGKFSDMLREGLMKAIDVGKEVLEWFQNVFIEAFNIGQKMYDMGREILERFIEGIKDAFTDSIDTLENVSGSISGFFGGSLPERGKLKHIEEYGKELMMGYSRGMERYEIAGAMERTTNVIVEPATASPSGPGPVTTTVNNYYLVEAEDFMDLIQDRLTHNIAMERKIAI